MADVNDSRTSINMKSDRIREFVGKVKIILVDSPKKVYMRKRWTAAFILLSQMLIGITAMIIFLYVLSFKSELLTNLHIFLCTIGFQLCIPSGILSLNSSNGSTIPMSTKDKKFEHVFLEICGIFCCLLGSIAITLEKSLSIEMTLHAILGVIGGCFVLFSGLTGLCISGKGMFASFMKYLHIIIGAFGFLTSSICFIFGLYRPCLENWIPVPSLIPFLVLFCSFYSVVITVASLKHLYKK